MKNKSVQELKQKLNRIENFLLISLMFGIPVDMIGKAIDEMKDRNDVKELINNFNQCQRI